MRNYFAELRSLNSHADFYSKARNLKLDLSLHLDPCSPGPTLFDNVISTNLRSYALAQYVNTKGN